VKITPRIDSGMMPIAISAPIISESPTYNYCLPLDLYATFPLYNLWSLLLMEECDGLQIKFSFKFNTMICKVQIYPISDNFQNYKLKKLEIYPFIIL